MTTNEDQATSRLDGLRTDELLARAGEELKVQQRRYLQERAQTNTDAEASRRTQVPKATLRYWKQQPVFRRFYDLIILEPELESRVMMGRRLHELTLLAFGRVEEYLQEVPDDEPRTRAEEVFGRERALVSLAFIKEVRSIRKTNQSSHGGRSDEAIGDPLRGSESIDEPHLRELINMGRSMETLPAPNQMPEFVADIPDEE